MPNAQIESQNKRLEFIDVLRGICIIFVIYSHVLIFWAGQSSFVNGLFIRWRMPLFFFISGFIGYSLTTTRESLSKKFKNRITKQLYPTILIWFLFIIFLCSFEQSSFKEHLLDGIFTPTKFGYWFTFSLVQVFILYIIMEFLLIGKDKKTKSIVYISATCISVIIYGLYVTYSGHISGIMLHICNVLSLEMTLPLMPFFFMGIVCRIFEKDFFVFVGNYKMFLCCLSLCCLSIILWKYLNSPNSLYYLSRIFGLFTILSIFIIYKDKINGKSKIANYLMRLGRNTLPIYLFHYFIISGILFIGFDITGFFTFIDGNPIYEVCTITIASIIVAELTMIFDRLLKYIPNLHHLIFMTK